jgi:hypothetical protein
MLGELLGEGSGRVAGIRVLPTEGQQVKLEVTIQGSNKMLGVEMTETATYLQTIRPGGVFYGEGHTVMLTKDGEIADWTGFGVGRPTGPGSAAHYSFAGAFHTAHRDLARLTVVTTIGEYDVDENGNYRWQLWEWK